MIIYKRTHTQIHTHQEPRVLWSCWANTHTKLRPELGPKIMFHTDRFTSKWSYEIKSPRPKCYWHSGFMIISQPSDSSYFPSKLLLETTSTNLFESYRPFFNFVARGSLKWANTKRGGGGGAQQKPQTHFGNRSVIAFTSKSHYTMFTGMFKAKRHWYKD